MNENEIVKYLKENKCKGVAFMLMPQDVRVWCINHKDEPIFSRLCSAGWDYTKRTIDTNIKNGVYFLSRDYEPKPPFKPHWEEFDVDEDGYFEFENKKYYYREDARFETENRDRFKGFGGWIYTEGGRRIWSMTPRISVRDSDITWSEPDIRGEYQDWPMTSHSDVDCADSDIEAKPVIPGKIRFWRYKE